MSLAAPGGRDAVGGRGDAGLAASEAQDSMVDRFILESRARWGDPDIAGMLIAFQTPKRPSPPPR